MNNYIDQIVHSGYSEWGEHFSVKTYAYIAFVNRNSRTKEKGKRNKDELQVDRIEIKVAWNMILEFGASFYVKQIFGRDWLKPISINYNDPSQRGDLFHHF